MTAAGEALRQRGSPRAVSPNCDFAVHVNRSLMSSFVFDLFGLLAFGHIENRLADAHFFGRGLHEFVVCDPFQRPVQDDRSGNVEVDSHFFGRRAVVRLGFSFGRIAGNVVGAGMLADHFAGVNFRAGTDKERAALLKVLQLIARRRSRVHADH